MSSSADRTDSRDKPDAQAATVYLNGEFIPLAHARISVLDRGFTFADAVYEVIPVFHGRLFRADRHLRRLRDSLAAIALPLDYSATRWHELFRELLRRNRMTQDGSLYIQVTRGAGERSHHYQAELTPTVFIMFRPLPDTDCNRGVSAVLHEDIRWQYCHIKSVALLANVLLRQYAREKDGSREAILVRDGYVTEGAASNVFIVGQGQVSTPPCDGKVLPGITRDLTLELARQVGLPYRESRVSETQLKTADEIWLTSSTLGIIPVTRLDGCPVSDGRPGPWWRRIHKAYRELRD